MEASMSFRSIKNDELPERDKKHHVVQVRLNAFSLRASMTVEQRTSLARRACHFPGKFENLHCTFVHNARSYLCHATGEGILAGKKAKKRIKFLNLD